jgi:hypothetical protein
MPAIGADAIVPESCRAYVGLESAWQAACDAVEPGAVRRFAQATMDQNPAYAQDTADNARYGGPVAPPLYPAHLFRRPFGTPDPLDAFEGDPDFDGLGATALHGLPELEPLRGYALLNGGMEVEFFRYALHGEAVTVRSRYASITGKATERGPMVFVVIESDYQTGDGALLLRTRRTQLRRKL